jgi:hypothetical protein
MNDERRKEGLLQTSPGQGHLDSLGRTLSVPPLQDILEMTV